MSKVYGGGLHTIGTGQAVSLTRLNTLTFVGTTQQSQEVDANNPPVSMRVTVDKSGEVRTFNLDKYSVRGPDFEVVLLGHDGIGQTTIDPGPVRTYRGWCEEEPDSYVEATLLPNGDLRYHVFKGFAANMGTTLLQSPTISLDKSVYYSGEDITVTYSGSTGNPTDAIAYSYSIYSKAGPYTYSFDGVTGTDGQIELKNILAPGEYTATYMYDGDGPIGNKVEFSVIAGPPTGRDVETKVLIGPGVTGGGLADPQVFKEGSTYYITGTYSFFNQSPLHRADH